MRPFLILLSLAFVPVSAAQAEQPLAGDWQCGDIRLVITRLGSIEVMSAERYRAGLVESAGGGKLRVSWDGGGTATLSIRRNGRAISVRGLGKPLDCVPRR